MAKPLEIRKYGDPVLRKKSKHVKEVNSEVRSLVGRMWNAMYDNKGIGLAAPQVGVSKKIIVVDTREEGEKMALVNPRVVSSGEEKDFYCEGCLSIPGLEGDVLRPVSVVVEAQDLSGKPVRIEADDLLARVLQHEIDHLNGILFVDLLAEDQKKKLDRPLREMANKTKDALAGVA